MPTSVIQAGQKRSASGPAAGSRQVDAEPDRPTNQERDQENVPGRLGDEPDRHENHDAKKQSAEYPNPPVGRGHHGLLASLRRRRSSSTPANPISSAPPAANHHSGALL